MSRRKSRKFKSNRQRVKQQAIEREKSGFGSGSLKYTLPKDTEFFEPQKGTMILNIVPYEVTVDTNPHADRGELCHKRVVFVHYNIGPENDTVLCRKTIGKRCPICEFRATLTKNWDDNEKEIKELRSSKREIFNIIDMDEDENAILFWEVAYSNFGEILDEEIEVADDDDPILGIADLGDRPILKVRFKPKKFMNNKFLAASKISPDEGDDFDEDILENVVNLDECLNILSYAELQKMFLELDDDEIEEDPAPEKPTKTKPKSRKKKPEPDPDPEEDEEKDEEPDPPKKTRPKPRRKKGKKDNPCPLGFVFGADCDQHDECDDCEKWDECMDENERLNKE